MMIVSVCLYVTVCSAMAPSGELTRETVVMKVPVEGAMGTGELVAFHNTSILDGSIVDTIEVRLSLREQAPRVVWTQAQRISQSRPFNSLSNRLLLYDLLYERGNVWLLYSRCLLQGAVGEVYLDLLAPNADGVFKVTSTTTLFRQDETSSPRLMSAGLLFEHDGAIHMGFRMLRDTHVIHRKDHPFELWTLVDGSAIEVVEPEIVNDLKDKTSETLDTLQSRIEKQRTLPKQERPEAD